MNFISLPNSSVTHSDSRKKKEKKKILVCVTYEDKKTTCYQFENF